MLTIERKKCRSEYRVNVYSTEGNEICSTKFHELTRDSEGVQKALARLRELVDSYKSYSQDQENKENICEEDTDERLAQFIHDIGVLCSLVGLEASLVLESLSSSRRAETIEQKTAVLNTVLEALKAESLKDPSEQRPYVIHRAKEDINRIRQELSKLSKEQEKTLKNIRRLKTEINRSRLPVERKRRPRKQMQRL